MDDGTEKEFKAGDVVLIPPGHDGWVVGNEPVVAIDFQGMTEYAKQSAKK
jgi:quercetin dioxygenase-like cupin family protein